MTNEARRITESEAGIFGRVAFTAGRFLATPQLDSMSPVECAVDAVRLKLGGKDALDGILNR